MSGRNGRIAFGTVTMATVSMGLAAVINIFSDARDPKAKITKRTHFEFRNCFGGRMWGSLGCHRLFLLDYLDF
jgi:hypothetical protein